MANQYYTDIYIKRLNKLGTDFQSRLEGQRAKEFENFLLKSPNRVDFEFEGEMVPGVLEQLKEGYSETQGYLLTKRETNLPSGTIISFSSLVEKDEHWLVWWQEQIKTSGYNRYVILKMTHPYVWWSNQIKNNSWGYLQTPGAKAFRDASFSGLKGSIISENNNNYLLITPYHPSFERDVYFEIQNKDKISAYRIVEFDNQATDGISYLTLESIARKSMSPAPEKTENDKEEDFFWLGGVI